MKVRDYLEGKSIQEVDENSGDLHLIQKNIFPIIRPSIYRPPLIGAEKPIHVFFLDKYSFNASAKSCDDGDVILLNTLSYKYIVGAWRAIMSHSPNLRPRQPRYRYLSPIEEINTNYQNWEFPPLIEESYDIQATQFAALTLEYILLHECAHIRNGHCDIRKNTYGSSSILENDKKLLMPEEALLKQTLEWDADLFATQDLLAHLLEVKTIPATPHARWVVPYCNAVGTPENALTIVCLVLEVAHAFFGYTTKFVPENLFTRSHPHTLIRRMYNYQQIVHNLKIRTDGSVFRNAEDAVAKSAKIAIDGFVKVFPIPDEVGCKIFLPTFKQVMEQYATQWSRIHSDLDKNKRSGKLAPPYPFY